MKFDLSEVARGKNLHLIGWNSGYLLVKFRGRAQQYVFGPDIPEAEFANILSNPFPDRIFTTNIKSKFQCAKLGAKG